MFALNNPTDQTVTLWLMAQRYELVGSQVIWPDLDSPRIANVTVSLGFKPENVENDYADIYRLVLEPGSTVTYIVELSRRRLSAALSRQSDQYSAKRASISRCSTAFCWAWPAFWRSI